MPGQGDQEYQAPQAITDAGYFSNSPGILSNNQWNISGKEYAPGKMGKSYQQVTDPNSLAKAKGLNSDLVNVGNDYYLSTADPNFQTILPKQQDRSFLKDIAPVLLAGLTGGAAGIAGLGGVAPAVAQTGVNAATGAASLPALASPASVGSFLSTVPEAVAGTQLPVGGALLDITAPGALQAATAAGNALGPGSGAPSLLPGTAATPEAIPTLPQAPTPPVGPQTAVGTPAPGPTPIANATGPAVSGAPVGGGGAGVPGGAMPGVPAPVTDLSVPASAADKARLATTSLADKAINAVTKNPLTAGALGLNLFAQANSRKQGKQLDQQLKAAGAPATAVGNQFLAQGASGKPSASSAYDIDKWAADTSAAIKQRYANMGRDASNDSAAAKELADVQAKAVAMRDAAAQGLVSQGLQAAQVGMGPTTQAALAAAQQDKDLASSMASTLNSLAMLQALQARAGG